MMNKIIPVCLILICLGGAASALYFFTSLNNNDELGSKREWSVLQQLENTYRGKQISSHIIVKQLHEYFAAGIMSQSNDSRVWILLNSDYHPLIKELPSKSYQLLPDEFEYILSEAEVNETVKKHLSSFISKPLGEKN